MLTKATTLLVLLCALIVGCENNSDPLAQERKVIRAVIERTGVNKLSPIVIDLRRSVDKRITEDLIGADQESIEVYRSYLLSNDTPGNLPIGANWKADTLLLDQAGYDGFFKHVGLEEGWHKFHQKYPYAKGIVGMSRAGFNRQQDVAIIYYKFGCGPDCGSGWLFKLQRGWLGWEVIEMEHLWAS
ncbi:MAG: hypothetical protein ACI9LO_002124 [Planctomycetota bacterium]|jgi:hypothetical protein